MATTLTDLDGAFAFGDLPPGFYGLRLSLPGGHLIHVHNLRVRPGETCRPRLLLSGKQRPTRFDPSPGAADGDFVVRGR